VRALPATETGGKEVEMPKLNYGTDMSTGPEPILAAAIDFTERRPEYWPNLSRKFYRVHEIGDRTADVTEGSDSMGGIWTRERYEWSQPGVVRATVQDSNVFRKGGVWELRATPKNGGGTRIEVVNHRQAKGLRGHILGALLQLTNGKPLAQSLAKTVAKVEQQAAIK
jgi:hypothetical protein